MKSDGPNCLRVVVVNSHVHRLAAVLRLFTLGSGGYAVHRLAAVDMLGCWKTFAMGEQSIVRCVL